MRRSLALLIPALVLAACTQSPTAATRQPSVRFDGGNYFGSGNLVGSGTENVTGATAGDGGITFGPGNTTGTGISLDGAGAAASLADSATSGERGTNYHGSGN